jgi:PIN domain nuclease of toxin-antitoxin system
LWLLGGDERLSRRAERLLKDASNEVLLSAAVVWEVAVKRSLGKLDAPDGFADLLLDAGAAPLGVSLEHAEAVAELPWHHRDPFDRMLVAQAGLEQAVLVTADERLHAYNMRVAW